MNALKKDEIDLQHYLDRIDEALIPFNKKQQRQSFVGIKSTDKGSQVYINEEPDPYAWYYYGWGNGRGGFGGFPIDSG